MKVNSWSGGFKKLQCSPCDKWHTSWQATGKQNAACCNSGVLFGQEPTATSHPGFYPFPPSPPLCLPLAPAFEPGSPDLLLGEWHWASCKVKKVTGNQPELHLWLTGRCRLAWYKDFRSGSAFDKSSSSGTTKIEMWKWGRIARWM